MLQQLAPYFCYSAHHLTTTGVGHKHLQVSGARCYEVVTAYCDSTLFALRLE